MNEVITQERLKEVLHYNPDTGIFVWKAITRRRIRKGDVAGSPSKGYTVIWIDKIRYREHRLVFLYVTGEFPRNEVDHINRIKNDNRWCNLRLVTTLENKRNLPMFKNNTSGFTGVCWRKREKKWVACIDTNYKKTHLGYFINKEDAIMARKEANIKYNFHPNHGK